MIKAQQKENKNSLYSIRSTYSSNFTAYYSTSTLLQNCGDGPRRIKLDVVVGAGAVGGWATVVDNVDRGTVRPLPEAVYAVHSTLSALADTLEIQPFFLPLHSSISSPPLGLCLYYIAVQQSTSYGLITVQQYVVQPTQYVLWQEYSGRPAPVCHDAQSSSASQPARPTNKPLPSSRLTKKASTNISKWLDVAQAIACHVDCFPSYRVRTATYDVIANCSVPSNVPS